MLNPLGPRTILTRSFYVRNPVYYLGVHYAADYIVEGGPTRGAPIVAADDGQAMASPLYDYYRGWNAKVWTPETGWLIGTAHMKGYNIPVNVWVPVKQGALLGWADNTGISSGDHCHVDAWNINKKSSEAVQKLGWWAHDPELYLGKEDDMDEATFKKWVREANQPRGITRLLLPPAPLPVPDRDIIRLRLDPPPFRADHWFSLNGEDAKFDAWFEDRFGVKRGPPQRVLSVSSTSTHDGIDVFSGQGQQPASPDVGSIFSLCLKRVGGIGLATLTEYFREYAD